MKGVMILCHLHLSYADFKPGWTLRLGDTRHVVKDLVRAGPTDVYLLLEDGLKCLANFTELDGRIDSPKMLGCEIIFADMDGLGVEIIDGP